MLDIKRLREDPEPFRAGLTRRGMAEAVDELLAADENRRKLTTRVEELRATQNQASKAIGKAAGDEKQRLIAEVGAVSAELKELEPQLADAEATLTGLLASTPNLPDPSAPDGGEDDAVEIKRNHDQPPAFDFEVRDHAAWGSSLASSIPSAARARAAHGSSICWATWCCCSSRWSATRWTSSTQEDFTR